MNNDLSKVTILITSFLRPGYLAACLAGVKENLPECKVIVIDDGGLAGNEIISLPFDSGLSAKRNAGVKATTTPYLLMGTDDFDFSTADVREGIEKMAAVLDSTPSIDVAGGNVNGNTYEGNLIVVPGQYINQVRVKQDPTGITPCDIVVNYFVARTESIRSILWDERMKIGGEHGDWFLSLKAAGKKVVAVAGVNINTLPYDPSKEDPRYLDFRNRAEGLGHRIFLEKYGVSRFLYSPSLDTIQTLWVHGKLQPMEQICLKSYLRHGHPVVLYTYDLSIGNVPDGVEIRDGNEIIPLSLFHYRDFTSLAAFSDYFRFKLLLEHGGWWVDTDTICIKPFDFESEYVFASEELKVGGTQVASAYIKAPVGAPILNYLWEQCQKTSPATIQWGKVGPELITRALGLFSLEKFVQPVNTFCPIPWWDVAKFVSPQNPSVPDETYAVHLWNEMWGRNGINKYFANSQSLYGQLLDGVGEKFLIAIVSCEKYKNRVQMMEETWLPTARKAGLDIQVFTGTILGVPDDYASLPMKTKALCKWALEKGYDFILKMDDDTYKHVNKFFPIFLDYAGIRIPANDGGSSILGIPPAPKGTYPYDYASGGAYWLSRRSMEIIMNAPFNGDWAEDRWVGNTLAKAGIPLSILPDYEIAWPHPFNHYVQRRESTILLTQIPLESFKTYHDNKGDNKGVIVPNWKSTFLEKKVQSLFQRFRFAAAVIPGSTHHRALCQTYPKHLEEVVNTPQGRYIIFVVENG